ncbi:hypothetical protein LCGC14_0397470 [marine sediment metagenome]|uniref:Uncharacterized protein n=1 Tax=marine sediment metagenome TaxID=412755 RepID=A0A0F9W711_9ZZZZ
MADERPIQGEPPFEGETVDEHAVRVAVWIAAHQSDAPDEPTIDLSDPALLQLLFNLGGGGRKPFQEPTPTWPTINPTVFYGIRDRLREEWADQLDVRLTDLPLNEVDFTRVLKDFGESFFAVNREFPTFAEALDSTELWTRAQQRTFDLDLLPQQFVIDDGQGPTTYINDPKLSVFPVPMSVAVGRFFDDEDDPNIPGDEDKFRALVGRGLLNKDFHASQLENLPQTTTASLQDFIAKAADRNKPRGGGGPRTISFDKTAAAENLRNSWRTLMLEEPGNVPGLINEYENTANNSLRAGNATPSFEVWTLNKMRSTSRYRFLYGRKDLSQSEIEYMNSFRQGVVPHGLDRRLEVEQLERGLSTGAAPAAFAESVAFSRDVQALGQGSFSRRFAGLINQLGPLQSA